MKTIPSLILSFGFLTAFAAGETAYRVKVPDLKGKEAKAILMFNDASKSIEIRPTKLVPVTIPYANIEKVSYQFTHEHAAVVAEEKVHWLQIDYHEGDAHKEIVVRMTNNNRIKILDALKAHTGIDAEIEGNVDKRRHK